MQPFEKQQIEVL